MTKGSFRNACVLGVAVICISMIGFGIAGSNRSKYSGRLYYSEGNSLVESDFRSGTKKNILELCISGGKPRLSRSCYDISRDNRLIAYQEEKFITTTGASGFTVVMYLIILDKYNQKIKFKQAIKERIVFPLSFSPDAKMLAYIIDTRESSGDPTLNVVRLSDGKNILSSIPAYNNSPTWAPDGTTIAFSDTWGRPAIIQLADRKKEFLPGKGSPMWSPNGEFIAVNEDYIWLTKQKKKVTLKLPERAIVVGWSPDSKNLLYTQEGILKNYPLYAYNVSSKKTTRILSTYGGSDNYPTVWRN